MLNFSFALTTTSMLVRPKKKQFIQQPLLLIRQLAFLPFLLLIFPPMVELGVAVSQMAVCLNMLSESGILQEPIIFILHII